MLERRLAATLAILAGALGCHDGASPTSPSAVEAAATSIAFATVSASGGELTCGLDTGNVLYCWGLGLVGNGMPSSIHKTPVRVGGALRFVQVSVGFRHICALTTNFVAYCWGDNSFGELGDGSQNTTRASPVRVAGGHQFRQLVAGALTTCGLTADNHAYCWGRNAGGNLGDGTKIARSEPVPVSGAQKFRQIDPGMDHTCAITTADKAYCWGKNGFGQLGDGTTTLYRLAPAAVAGGLRFTQISAGDSHTCALTTDARGFCWGTHGLGNGQKGKRLTPQAVSGLHDFRSIAAGADHSCGITDANAAYCWGVNGSGQVGDGTTNSRAVPVAVKGGLLFAQLSAGGQTCGVTPAGVGYCWGNNGAGQLGDGTTTERHAPQRIAAPK